MKRYAANIDYLVNKLGLKEENAIPILNYLQKLKQESDQNKEKIKFLKYVTKQLKTLSQKNKNLTLQDLQEEVKIFEQEGTLDPRIENKINNITNIKSEKDWIKKLYKENKLLEEDFINIYPLLERLHKIPELYRRDINNFENDAELFGYLEKVEENERIPDETLHEQLKDVPGWKLLESYNSNLGKVNAYFINDQKPLDILGKGGSWCVLRGTKYTPHEFYLFRINNDPAALLHIKKSELKNKGNETVKDGQLIKAIDPVIQKYNLIEDDNYDFKWYNEVLEDIKKIESGDEEYRIKRIKEEPKVLNLMKREERNKYFPYVTIEGLKDTELISNLGYDVSDNLSRYFKINNDEEKFNILEELVLNWLKNYSKNISYGFIRETVPKILRTEKFKENHKDFSLYNIFYFWEEDWFPENYKEKAKEIEKKNSEYHIYEYPEDYEEKIKNDPNRQDLENDPDILELRKQGWINLLKNIPDSYEEKIKNDPKRQNLANDEEMLKARKRGWINKLKKGPWDHEKYIKNDPDRQDLVNDPDILKARKKGWINQIKFERPYRENPYIYDYLKYYNPDLANDPDILKAAGITKKEARNTWASFFNDNFIYIKGI